MSGGGYGGYHQPYGGLQRGMDVRGPSTFGQNEVNPGYSLAAPVQQPQIARMEPSGYWQNSGNPGYSLMGNSAKTGQPRMAQASVGAPPPVNPATLYGGEMGAGWQNPNLQPQTAGYGQNEGNPGYTLGPPPMADIWQNEQNPGYSLTGQRRAVY